MKVRPPLLQAMLIAATMGLAATSCTTMKTQQQNQEENTILPANNADLLDKVINLLAPRRGDNCPACGMG